MVDDNGLISLAMCTMLFDWNLPVLNYGLGKRLLLVSIYFIAFINSINCRAEHF